VGKAENSRNQNARKKFYKVTATVGVTVRFDPPENNRRGNRRGHLNRAKSIAW
jgi:hypothetical protein